MRKLASTMAEDKDNMNAAATTPEFIAIIVDPEASYLGQWHRMPVMAMYSEPEAAVLDICEAWVLACCMLDEHGTSRGN